MLRTFVSFALVLTLAACAATAGPPEPLAGQPDTYRLRMFLAAGTTDSGADQQATKDLEAYRAKNGYRTYAIVDRKFVSFPVHIEYTVRFER